MGGEDGCDGSWGISFLYRTQMICKTKEQQPWNNAKKISPEQKTKKSFALGHLCPVHELWVEFWNPLIFGEIVNSFGQERIDHPLLIWSGKVYIWLAISKTIPLATMSQEGHACWELRNWSTSTWTVCGHFIQIHSCMGICFSCMYTNNREHFHKWFGTLYRDNSVLMRVLHIQ